MILHNDIQLILDGMDSFVEEEIGVTALAGRCLPVVGASCRRILPTERLCLQIRYIEFRNHTIIELQPFLPLPNIRVVMPGLRRP